MTEIDLSGADAGSEFLSGMQKIIQDKDDQIAKLTEDNKRLVSISNVARSRVEEFESSLREALLALVEDGEDKAMLRGIAESTGIETETQIIKKVTVSAEVEIFADMFDEIDDYGFDFRIFYNNDELQIQGSDIEVEDGGY
jgi:hypothetical protein